MAVDTLEQGRTVLARRTRAARVALWVFIATWTIFALAAIGGAAGMTDTALEGESAITAFSGLFAFIALIVSHVFVAMWLYRAQANLHLAGCHGLEFTPGWAVGWYFIPFANLVKPFQAMRELWVTSNGLADRYADEVPGRLGAWWACWIIGNILSNAGTRLQAMPGSEAAQIGLGIDTIGTLITIAAALLLIRIINRINEVQQTTLGVAHTFA